MTLFRVDPSPAGAVGYVLDFAGRYAERVNTWTVVSPLPLLEGSHLGHVAHIPSPRWRLATATLWLRWTWTGLDWLARNANLSFALRKIEAKVAQALRVLRC